MKKQYLIIGLAGLMASNAVSTSYGNRELDEYLAKCGLPQGSLLPEGTLSEKPGFCARHATLIKTAGGVALAGALGLAYYQLNKNGKLPEGITPEGLKNFVTSGYNKFTSLFSRSSTPVNNKPLGMQLVPVETGTSVPSFKNTKKIGSENLPLNTDELANLVRTEEKVLLLPAPPKASVENKPMGTRFGSWFSRSSKVSDTCAVPPATKAALVRSIPVDFSKKDSNISLFNKNSTKDSNISLFNKNRTNFQEIAKNISSPISGHFVPNAENPKTFIVTKPSLDVQKGSSAFDSYMKNHTEVFNASKKNLDVFVNDHIEVARGIKANVASFFSRIFRK